VGAVASAAIMVLPALLERIHAAWPDLQLQIMEAVEDKLAAALAANDIDVALSGAIPESDAIMRVAEHKFTDRAMAIAATTHPLQQRAQLSVHDLATESWIMPSADAEPRKRFDELIAQLAAAPARVVVETRSPATIKAVVAQTRLLGWLPEPLFAAEQAAGLIRPLPCADLICERHFFVHRRRRNFMAPPLVQFLQALQQ
jgi:DNA-binding transcriptional LysR family regulator